MLKIKINGHFHKEKFDAEFFEKIIHRPVQELEVLYLDGDDGYMLYYIVESGCHNKEPEMAENLFNG